MPPAFCFSRKMIKIKSTLSMNLTLNVLPKAKLTRPMNSGTRSLLTDQETSELYLVLQPLPGSPCDGHTIDVLLKQLKRINGTQAEILIVDHGYPGEKYFGKTQKMIMLFKIKAKLFQMNITDKQIEQINRSPLSISYNNMVSKQNRKSIHFQQTIINVIMLKS